MNVFDQRPKYLYIYPPMSKYGFDRPEKWDAELHKGSTWTTYAHMHV